jgi:hypothetical protein
MRYQLGVEDVEPGYWIAWVFELPGCFSTGKTRAEAISQAGASIAGYQRWLSQHWLEHAFEDPYIDVHVVEVIEAVQTEPDYMANAFFDDDRVLLGSDDAAYAHRLLGYTRGDLSSLVERIAPAKRMEAIAGERFGSIDGILKHVADAEWWYLDRLGMAFPKVSLPSDAIERLEVVRTRLIERLPSLVGYDQIVWKNGEGWSARKLVRRALWHERDHTQHIARIVQKTSEVPKTSVSTSEV